ncbi:hypothetical protein ACFQ6Q_36380 [Streptomyces sp. NPDC056437]|uniref:hypothetical protein n=1 Tax=Streptomyces sp. NPDC056437 TaxID=3345816 RepID=UPI0036A1EB2E
MTVPPDHAELAQRTAALCALLGSSDHARPPEVRTAAERVLTLLRSGDADDAAVAGGYNDLDHVLRRAGYAGGLLGESRSSRAPGVLAHIKVAVCPGPAHCSRLERARDLLPAPHCAVNDTRMLKSRLSPAR